MNPNEVPLSYVMSLNPVLGEFMIGLLKHPIAYTMLQDKSEYVKVSSLEERSNEDQ